MFVVSSNRASLEWTLARFAFAVKTNCESGRGTVVFLWWGGRSPRRGQLPRDWVHSGFSNAQAILSDRGRHCLLTVTKFLRLLLVRELVSRVGNFSLFFRDIDNFYSVQLFHREFQSRIWITVDIFQNWIFQLIPSWLIVLLVKVKYFDDEKRHFV